MIHICDWQKELFALTQSLNLEVFWQIWQWAWDTYMVKALIITPFITSCTDLCDLYSISISFPDCLFSTNVSFMFGLNLGQGCFHLLNVFCSVRTNTHFIQSQKPSRTFTVNIYIYMIHILFLVVSVIADFRWTEHGLYYIGVADGWDTAVFSIVTYDSRTAFDKFTASHMIRIHYIQFINIQIHNWVLIGKHCEHSTATYSFHFCQKYLNVLTAAVQLSKV